MKKENSIALKPSKVWLPESTEYSTVLDFLIEKFTAVPPETWIDRIERGKVSFASGEQVSLDTVYQSSVRVQYYRELGSEEVIPFEESILFENENILIADKPHFLALHPAGNYINETLLNRLRLKTGIDELNGAHRIDRLTAGLVLFTKRREVRSLYQNLFMNNEVSKVYEARGGIPEESTREWHVKNRLVTSEPWFRMEVGEGAVNSESYIELLEEENGVGHFQLRPVTGKKHQLRVHMCCIGSSILNDPFYPDISEESADDFSKPLKLLAKKLSFKDPITSDEMVFQSRLTLDS